MLQLFAPACDPTAKTTGKTHLLYKIQRCWSKTIVFAVFGFWKGDTWKAKWSSSFGFHQISKLVIFLDIGDKVRNMNIQIKNTVKLEWLAAIDLASEKLDQAANGPDLNVMYRTLSCLKKQQEK